MKSGRQLFILFQCYHRNPAVYPEIIQGEQPCPEGRFPYLTLLRAGFAVPPLLLPER